MFYKIKPIHSRVSGPDFRLGKFITNGGANAVIPTKTVSIKLHGVRKHVYATKIDSRDDEGRMQSYHFLLEPFLLHPPM
jgi:hypothetical protein